MCRSETCERVAIVTRVIAPEMAGDQGDQIGRIFAHWAIVFFGQFF
jgi:hypothetical protein